MANNLHQAKNQKKDEFYTQYADIEKEMNAYLEYNQDVFRDKTVLLPCDDPEWSNFTKYFAQNFDRFGLKKLISTSYAASSKPKEIWYQPTLFELDDPEYDESKTRTHGKIFTLTRRNKKVDINDLKWKYLEGDGDFRSDEVKRLRDNADIIITNPPFSLFREFLAWLMEGNKLFSIIGNQNAITYKEVFPLLKENKMWLGNGFKGNVGFFKSPYDDVATSSSHQEGKIRVSGVMWFTNIEHGKRHQPLVLMSMQDNLKFNSKKFPNKKYQEYYNFDAIDVSETKLIPGDYDGIMGVPITFMDKYNPEQFEIIGLGIANLGLSIGVRPYEDEHRKYRKEIQKRGTVDGDLYKLDEYGHPDVPYARILIRKK